MVPLDPDRIRTWFDQRWQANGHKHFFSGPENGMLMTTGFWHMRSKNFPREYAAPMTESWALRVCAAHAQGDRQFVASRAEHGPAEVYRGR